MMIPIFAFFDSSAGAAYSAGSLAAVLLTAPAAQSRAAGLFRSTDGTQESNCGCSLVWNVRVGTGIVTRKLSVCTTRGPCCPVWART